MSRLARKCVLQVAAAIAVCGLLAGEPDRSTAAAQRKPAAKKKKPGSGSNNAAAAAAAKKKQALINKINAYIKSATSKAKAADAAANRAIGPVQAAKNAHDKAEYDLKSARQRVESVEEYLVSTASADTPLGKARLAHHDAKDNYSKVRAEVLADLDSPDAAARIKAVAESPKIQEAKRRVTAAATPMRKESAKLLASDDKWTTAKYQVKMLGSAERTAEREWKANISVYGKAKAAAVAARKVIAYGKRALASAKAIKTPTVSKSGSKKKPRGKK